MIPFALISDRPWSLKLAADARLTTTDYGDDAIYALQSGTGPLGLGSSYGRRCASMQCDLSWQLDGSAEPVSRVTDYAVAPVLHDCGPGFALLEAEPLPLLGTRIAFIAHTSHATVGHIELHNRAATSTQFTLTISMRLQLNAPFDPATDQISDLSLEGQTHAALVQTQPLQLALCWDTPGSYTVDPLGDGPGWHVHYRRELVLALGERRTLIFGLLTPSTPADVPHTLAQMSRDILATSWTHELACHQAASATIPVVETGDSDWDSAIACAYRMAARCYLTGSGDFTPRPEVAAPDGRAPDIRRSGRGGPPLPYPSFVCTRIPERGYPPDGDPREHIGQWNGQVATDAYISVSHVVAFAPDLAKAVLQNFLHIQQTDGFIDWKPGLGGQRAGWDCVPLLASVARMIFDYTGDVDFLHDVFAGLLRHLDRWFDPTNERNGDGYPEWTHTVQSAFDQNPSFAPWHTWSQGADISMALSPDIGAYLYRQHLDLIAIGRLLPDQRRLALNVDLVRLTHRADQLRDMVEALWDDARNSYLYADYDSHLTHPGELVWETHGPGEWQHTHKAEGGNGKVISIAPPIPPAALARRVVVRVTGPVTPHIAVMLQGKDASEQSLVEVLERRRFLWWDQDASAVISATSEGRFADLTAISVVGISHQHQVRISFVDYTRQNLTQLLPLWAGIPDATRADRLVRQTITDPQRFWRPFGMPSCSAQDPAYARDKPNGSGGVGMLWNTMIGEGLCDYGYFSEAWELFSRIISAQILSLKMDHCFYATYDADSGAGLGDPDYLWGNVPLHLLTRLHGVQILAANHVRLLPSDTLDRRVVVRQHGVSVERTGRMAVIIWPDDQRQELVIGAEAVVLERP